MAGQGGDPLSCLLAKRIAFHHGHSYAESQTRTCNNDVEFYRPMQKLNES